MLKQVYTWVRSKHFLFQLGVAAVLIWGVAWAVSWVKRYVSGPKETDVDWSNIPIVGEENGEPKQWDPSQLSAELYNEMKGIDYATAASDPRWKPWSRLASLQTDDQVKAVYNHFNKNYASGSTLTEWIRGEWPSSISRSSKRDALDRLNSIGLT